MTQDNTTTRTPLSLLVTDPMALDQIRAALVGHTFSLRGSNVGSTTIQLEVADVQFLPDRGDHGTYLLLDKDREYPNDCYVTPDVLAAAINTGQGRSPFDASTDIIFSFPQRMIDLERSREGAEFYNHDGQFTFDARQLFDALESHPDLEDPVRLLTPLGDVMRVWSEYYDDDDAYNYYVEMASERSIATYDTIPRLVNLLESYGFSLTNKVSLLPEGTPIVVPPPAPSLSNPAIPLTEVKLLDEVLRGATLTLRHPLDLEDDEFKNILYVDPDRQDPDIVTIISKSGDRMTVEKADLLAALSPTAAPSTLEYDVSPDAYERLLFLQERINATLTDKVIGVHRDNAIELYFDDDNRLMVDYHSSEGDGTSSYEDYMSFIKPLLIQPKTTQERTLTEQDIENALAAHVRLLVDQLPGAEVSDLPDVYLSQDNYREYRYALSLRDNFWLDGAIGFDRDEESGRYLFSSHSIDVTNTKTDRSETLYYDKPTSSDDIINAIRDKIDQWQRHSAVDLDVIAQRLLTDLHLSALPDVSADSLAFELPDKQYILLDFEYADDNRLRRVDVSTDVTDKAIIRLTGTPITERYSLARNESFDYDILRAAVSKVIDTYCQAVDRKEAYPDALRERHNKELGDMSERLIDDLSLRRSVSVTSYSNHLPLGDNTQQLSLIADTFRLDVNLIRAADHATVSRLDVVLHNEDERTQPIVGTSIRQTIYDPSDDTLYAAILSATQGVMDELRRGDAVAAAREQYKELLDSLTPYNDGSSAIHEDRFEADVKSGDLLKLLGSNNNAIYVYSENDAADEYRYFMRPEGQLSARMFDSLSQLIDELTLSEVPFIPSAPRESSNTLSLPTTDEQFIEELLQGEGLILYRDDGRPSLDISDITTVARHPSREDLLVLTNDTGDTLMAGKDRLLSAMFGTNFEAMLEYNISGNIPGKIVTLTDEITSFVKGKMLPDSATPFTINHALLAPNGRSLDNRIAYNVISDSGAQRSLSPSAVMALARAPLPTSREALLIVLNALLTGSRVGELFDDALGQRHYYEPTITGVSLEGDTVTLSLQGTTAGAFYTTVDQARRLLSPKAGSPATLTGDRQDNLLVLDPSLQDQYLLEEHSHHPLRSADSAGPWGDKEYTLDFTALKGGTVAVYDRTSDTREIQEIFGDLEHALADALRTDALVAVERVLPADLIAYADIIRDYPLNTLVFVEKDDSFVAYGADAIKAHELVNLPLTIGLDDSHATQATFPKTLLSDYLPQFAAQPTLFLSPTGYGPTHVQYHPGAPAQPLADTVAAAQPPVSRYAADRIDALKAAYPDSFIILRDGSDVDVLDAKDFEIFAMNGYGATPSSYRDADGHVLNTISLDADDFVDAILPTLTRFTSVVVADVAHPDRAAVVIPSVFDMHARFKDDHPNAVLLFRDYNTYNAYNADADLTYELLGLTYGAHEDYGVNPRATSSSTFTREMLSQHLQTLADNNIPVRIVDYNRLLQPYIDAMYGHEPRDADHYDWSDVSFSTVMDDAHAIASRLVDDLTLTIADDEVKVNNFISDPLYRNDLTETNADGVELYIPFRTPHAPSLSDATHTLPDHLRVSFYLDKALMADDPSRSLDKVVIVAGSLFEEASRGRAEQVLPAADGQSLDYALLLATIRDVLDQHSHNVAHLAQMDARDKQLFIHTAATQDGFADVDSYLEDIEHHPERLEAIFRATDYHSRDKFLQDYEEVLHADICTDGDMFYDKSVLSPLEAASLEKTFSFDESLFRQELENHRHLLLLFPDGQEREVYVKTNHDPNLEIGKDYFYVKEKHSLGSELSESFADLLTALKDYGLTFTAERQEADKAADATLERYLSLPVYNEEGEYDLNEKVLLSDLLHCADEDRPIRLRNEAGGEIIVYSSQDAVDEAVTYHVREFSRPDAHYTYDSLSALRASLEHFGFQTHNQQKEKLSVPYVNGRLSSLKDVAAATALQREVKVALEGKTLAWKDLNGDGDIDVNEVRVLSVSMDTNDRDYRLTGVDAATGESLSWTAPSATLLRYVRRLTRSEARAKRDSQSSPDRQVELLMSALTKSKDSYGVWLNADRKAAPTLYHMRASLSPFNSLLLALHSDSIHAKTNNYTDFTVARYNGMPVLEGQSGIPLALDADQPSHPLFNIDQTRLPLSNRKEYDRLLRKKPSDSPTSEYVDKDRLPVNHLLLQMKEMLPIRYAAGMTAHYDANRDALVLETRLNDRPEDLVRAVISATGGRGRLDRDGQRPGASRDAQRQELLVVELAAAAKLLEMGLPARLSADGLRTVSYWNRELSENPDLLPALIKDVNAALAMIHQVEQGEKVGQFSSTAAAEFMKEVHTRNDNTLIFFRAGDHYEALADDAIRYAKLRNRDCDYPNSLGQVDDDTHKNSLTSALVAPQDMADELRALLREGVDILLADVNKENHHEVSLTASSFRDMGYDQMTAILADVLRRDEPLLTGVAVSSEDPSRRTFIADAIRQQPSIESKTLVLVIDRAHQYADVILPVGASPKSDGRRHGFDKALICSSLKDDGVSTVHFFNPDGKLGYYKDDAYFKGREVLLAHMGEHGVEKTSTMDIAKAVSFADAPIFERIQMVRDDDNAWALYIKEEGGEPFAIYPDKADVDRFFATLHNHPDAVDALRMELGRKYSALAHSNPALMKDLTVIDTEDLDLSLIKHVNIFKNKEGKLFCKAAIDGVDNPSAKPLTASQWQRLWLAPDVNKYKVSLAAVLYADLLREQMRQRQAALPPTYVFEQTQTLKAKYGADALILARVDDHYEAYDPADVLSLSAFVTHGSYTHPSYTDEQGTALHPIRLSLEELRTALAGSSSDDHALLNREHSIIITDLKPSSEDVIIPSVKDIWTDFKQDTRSPLLLDIGSSYVSYNPDAHIFDSVSGNHMGVHEIGLSFPKAHFAQTQKNFDSKLGSYAIVSMSSFIDPLLKKEEERQHPALTAEELQTLTTQLAGKPLGISHMKTKNSYEEIVIAKVERVKDNTALLRLVPHDKSQQAVTLAVSSLRDLLRTQVTTDVIPSGMRNLYLGDKADAALLRTVHAPLADAEGRRVELGAVSRGMVALTVNGQPTDARSISEVATALRDGTFHSPTASNDLEQPSAREEYGPSNAPTVTDEEEQVRSRGMGR